MLFPPTFFLAKGRQPNTRQNRVTLNRITIFVVLKKKPITMRIKEYLENLPLGEVLNKKALAYFKRIGYIWDYSKFGYLEGIRVQGIDGYNESFYLELSKNKNSKFVEGLEGAMYEKWRQTSMAYSNKYTAEELREFIKPTSCFEWEGMEFSLKYYDGCFCPYLIKTKGSARGAVNHRWAFPGGVV